MTSSPSAMRNLPVDRNPPRHAVVPGAVISLQRQLQGLLRGVQRAADRCDQIAPPHRQNARQFIELAAIELAEGLKVLKEIQQADERVAASASVDSACQIHPPAVMNLEAIQQLSCDFAEPRNINQHVATPLDLSSEKSLPNFENPLEQSLPADDIPEAYDLQTILENLRASQLDDAEHPEVRPAAAACQTARHDLLSFDACQYGESAFPPVQEPLPLGYCLDPVVEVSLPPGPDFGHLALPICGGANSSAVCESRAGPTTLPGAIESPQDLSAEDEARVFAPAANYGQASAIRSENLYELESLKAELDRMVQECRQSQAPLGPDSPPTDSFANPTPVHPSVPY